MAHDLLARRRTGGVLTVTIDHPPTNLVDAELLVVLAGLASELETDPETKVVVFTSADPDFFAMHGDVQAILDMPRTGPAPIVTEPNFAAATFERVRRLPLLTIGVLDGAARGGGAELFTALDVRLASTRSVLGQPEVPMGILPGAGGTARLARLLGRAACLEVVLTGRDVDAAEALALGWVDAVHPPDELAGRAEELARRVARMSKASVAAVKRTVDASLGSYAGALTTESGELAALINAGGHVEPMTRFLSAGGQTREAETTRMAAVIDATLG
jgi:enoyl-CoA hydratase/carnithine racemase